MQHFVFAAFALSVFAAFQPAAEEETNPLLGAWQVAELTATSPDK